MTKTINFIKDEKLAILRIMIEINNCYSTSLPNASMFIEDVAVFFDIQNEVNSLTVSDAQNILGENLINDGVKAEFVLDILNYLLKDDKITARYKNIEVKYFKVPINYEEIDKDLNGLNCSFRSKWNYAVKLTKPIFKLQFSYQNYNPLKKYSCVKSTTTQSVTTQQITKSPINDKPNTVLKKVDVYNRTSDFSFENLQVQKELIDLIRRELKEEVRKEFIDLRNELMEFINNELHKGMKDFAKDNFNETLYKDL